MHFLKKLRSPSRSKSAGNESISSAFSCSNSSHSSPAHSDRSIDTTRQIPRHILSKIFSYICPHALDESYKSAEESMTEDGCMLCDMRDLAHCALVCKRWHSLAQTLLYQHVRIDAVHYCELEIELSSKRKRRSFVDRTGKSIDAPQMRLLLFMRTVRDSSQFANMVFSVRLPYMTRESSKSELARTISVLPHLRYVDLPAGFFSDDVSSYTLKQELMANCPEIRRMTYAHGSEGSFSRIPGSGLWKSLEVLELSDLQIEESTLRLVLSSFPILQSLKLDNLQAVRDSVFMPTQSLPPFPAVKKLIICKMPQLTANGLATHLSIRQNRDALTNLVLVQTGVLAESLHLLLSQASQLTSLTLEAVVERLFPVQDVPLLASKSVKTLHYEIATATSSYGMQPVSGSYYKYLLASLTSNSLPALRQLYVLDAHFADSLLYSPPPRFGAQAAGYGITQSLSLYTKGIDELEWNLTEFEPISPPSQTSPLSQLSPSSANRASATRPVSFHAAQLSTRWGGDARESVVVGNGFGGFLAVPVNEGRPKSTEGCSYKRSSKYDMWR
ncbi:F-box domain protein [Talaromyces proteolyticus]|uniref:F-box domain protein n=1 Tax=Talaromyces proteolyticus TaxID=1131652 RepID=A0AAD4KVI7_9EURO|nr:F-box domain protein [Talaromyces proteolyticus]KAH8701997.1 F-box domain protein [Talaromyces proteolyticus]